MYKRQAQVHVSLRTKLLGQGQEFLHQVKVDILKRTVTLLPVDAEAAGEIDNGCHIFHSPHEHVVIFKSTDGNLDALFAILAETGLAPVARAARQKFYFVTAFKHHRQNSTAEEAGTTDN